MKAENDKTITDIVATYKKQVQETESDADLYAALKEADGIKLLREAEAKARPCDATPSPQPAAPCWWRWRSPRTCNSARCPCRRSRPTRSTSTR